MPDLHVQAYEWAKDPQRVIENEAKLKEMNQNIDQSGKSFTVPVKQGEA